MTFPKLYKKTSTGAIQTWKIDVEPSLLGELGAPYAQIVTVYGLQLGKKQVAKEMIKEGKNLGKANETTPLEQAMAEAQSQWQKKVDKGYVQNVEDAAEGKVDTNSITGGIDPMLAYGYDKQGHKISFPAFVQPKLDGHRCIAIIQDGVCTLWSRNRKPILSMPHICKQLEWMFPTKDQTFILDGELYNHDYREKFEELTSKIKQTKPVPGHEVVQFWIYDVVTEGPFWCRKEMLDGIKALLNDDTPSLVVVDTQTVDDADEMISVFGVYISYGFEGLMVRNESGLYKNKRSYDLQKVKLQNDSEFKIVGIKEGKGKMAGKAIFICDAGNNNAFGCKMMGSLESLKEYFENADKYIGEQLTVKYQNLSADGIPRFPIGLRFREDV